MKGNISLVTFFIKSHNKIFCCSFFKIRGLFLESEMSLSKSSSIISALAVRSVSSCLCSAVRLSSFNKSAFPKITVNGVRKSCDKVVILFLC
ncbi:hypothetical protein DS832_06435 [Bombilactobacillus bombi]|uniref:Hydrophobic seed protein domain-containing protein n=1 Tax=Bombilactobacillus bombi TaxID=1303590 RepID=A0A417Z5Y1_9LACO|nr:hypothetical protein DS832_06435 [Bombilactobacillus bombi]